MKKYTISNVAQKIGLSKVINEAHEIMQPIFLESNGKVVAAVMPCTDEALAIQNNIFNFAKVLGMVAKKDDDDKLAEHLISSFINGMVAESLLYEMGQQTIVKHLREGLVTAIMRSFKEAEIKLSSEDRAMLESNLSADETGADKQTERSVVRSANSEKKKSPAKAKNSRPKGGTASKGVGKK